MKIAAGAFRIIKGISTSALAALLLLAPVCGALCQAEACESPRAAAEKSGCHEAAGMTAAPAGGTFLRSVANCSLRDLPAARPAGGRMSADSAVTNVFSGSEPATAISSVRWPEGQTEFSAPPGSRRAFPPDHQSSLASWLVLRI